MVDLQYADNSPQKPVRFREEVNRKYNANFYFCEIPLDKDAEEQLKELKKHLEELKKGPKTAEPLIKTAEHLIKIKAWEGKVEKAKALEAEATASQDVVKKGQMTNPHRSKHAQKAYDPDLNPKP